MKILTTVFLLTLPAVGASAQDAIPEMRKQAVAGVAEAQYRLGLAYAVGGLSLPKDDTEAVKWYRKAADQGLAAAQDQLARMYEEGRGVQRDEAEAFKWYRKAAEQGHEEATYNLAVRYLRGMGVPKDEVEAIEWYRKAAEHGRSDAQYALGLIYENGWGVPKDQTEAAKWYAKSAETTAQGTKRREEAKAKAKKP